MSGLAVEEDAATARVPYQTDRHQRLFALQASDGIVLHQTEDGARDLVDTVDEANGCRPREKQIRHSSTASVTRQESISFSGFIK